MLKLKKSKFALVLSILLCCCMVFCGTAMAADNSTMAVYHCTGIVSDTVESTGFFTGAKYVRTYCFHTAYASIVMESHLCRTDKYDNNGKWISTDTNCPYGGGGGGTARSIEPTAVNSTLYCSGDDYETVIETGLFTGRKYYRTYRWTNERDGIGIRYHISTHLCFSEVYSKDGKWLDTEQNCPYGGGGGIMRTPSITE